MAKLSKKEMAAKCGMVQRAFMVYVKRPKGPVMTDAGEFDESDPKNQAFIEKYSRKAQAKGKTVELSVIHGEKPAAVGENSVLDGPVPVTGNLEYQKLALQVQKLENENEKLRLGNQKTIGSFVTIEPIKVLMTQLSEAIFVQCENEIGDVILKLAAKYQLSRDEIASIKRERTDSMNNVRLRAVAEAKKGLRKLQNDVADKRMRGEHGDRD